MVLLARSDDFTSSEIHIFTNLEGMISTFVESATSKYPGE
jgi:hypothetical protein